MAGQSSPLSDPDFARRFAELFVRGVSKEEIADEMGCRPDTVRKWAKDPRVQAHAKRIAQERIVRITRRIDGELEARLAHIEDWDLDEMLKVRREMLDRPLKITDGDLADSGSATQEIAEAMDEDPTFAKQLADLVAAKE